MVHTVSKSTAGGGGGGGFPDNAEQTAIDSQVSISSISSSGSDNSFGSYEFGAVYAPGTPGSSSYINTDCLEHTSENEAHARSELFVDTDNAQAQHEISVQNNNSSQVYLTRTKSDLLNKQAGIYQSVQEGVVAGSCEIATFIEGGTVKTGLLFTDSEFVLEGLDITGSDTATFIATNAPGEISPQRWLKVTIGGQVGYIPWFSTPTPP